MQLRSQWAGSALRQAILSCRNGGTISIKKGDIDPSFVITHRMKPSDAPVGFDIFNNKKTTA
jgi:hypothetical protein